MIVSTSAAGGTKPIANGELPLGNVSGPGRLSKCDSILVVNAIELDTFAEIANRRLTRVSRNGPPLTVVPSGLWSAGSRG